MKDVINLKILTTMSREIKFEIFGLSIKFKIFNQQLSLL